MLASLLSSSFCLRLRHRCSNGFRYLEYLASSLLRETVNPIFKSLLLIDLPSLHKAERCLGWNTSFTCVYCLHSRFLHQWSPVPQAGETALYLAADGGHEECVSALLEERCDPNIISNVGTGQLAYVNSVLLTVTCLLINENCPYRINK